MGREEGKQEEMILAFSRKLWVLRNADTAKAFHRRNQLPFGNAAVMLLGRLLCLLFLTWVLCMDFIPFLSPDLKEHNNWCFLTGFNEKKNYLYFIWTVIWSEPSAQTSNIQVIINESTLLMCYDIGSCYSNGLAQISLQWLWCVAVLCINQVGAASCMGMEMGKIP